MLHKQLKRKNPNLMMTWREIEDMAGMIEKRARDGDDVYSDNLEGVRPNVLERILKELDNKEP